MSDSIQSIDKKCIFRSTFENEQSVRNNNITPANVTFLNGVATLPVNGQLSLYKYFPAGTYTIRIKVRPTSFSTYKYLFDNTSNAQPIYLTITTGVIAADSGTFYVNGSASNVSTLNVWNDIIVSGFTFKSSASYSTIGNLNTLGLNGDIDLFEIYQGTLTADEVKNLYENKRYREVSGHGKQLGPELVDPSWNAVGLSWWTSIGTGITGDGTKINVNGSTQTLQKNDFWEVGTTYEVTMTVTVNSSYISSVYAANTPDYYYSSGTYTLYIVPNNTFMRIGFWYTDGSITALSIKKYNIGSIKEILNVSAQDGTIRNKYSGDMHGSELVTNGNFDSVTTGWVNGSNSIMSIETGVLKLTKTNSGGYDACAQLLNLTSGKQYRLIFSYKKGTASNLQLWIGEYGGVQSYNSGALSNSDWTTVTTIFTATATNYIQPLISGDTGNYCYFDSISIKEVIPSVIPTSVEVVKDNDVWAMKFNGTTSVVQCSNYDALVGDKTFVTWVNLDYMPSYNLIFTSTSGLFFTVLPNNLSSGHVLFDSNNSTDAVSASGSVRYKTPTSIIITRTSIGITNIYVNGVLSGTANQSSGTPQAGTTISIGKHGISYTGKGLISSVRIYDGLMTSAEISQLYSNEKKQYGL